MLNSLRTLLSPPTFPDDENKTRLVSTLNYFLLATSAGLVFMAIILYVTGDLTAGNLLLSLGGVNALALGLARRGWTIVAGGLASLASLAVLAYLAYIGNGYLDVALAGLPAILILSTLLVNRRAPLGMALASIALLVAMGVAQLNGVLVRIPPSPSPLDLALRSVILVLMAVMLERLVANQEAVVARMRRNEAELTASNRDLRDLQASLERRVSERTRALAIAGEVSRQLSTILERNELVTAVVDRVQKAFDYYHVHIYLLDEARQNLVMVGGTGEAGQKMLERGHSVPLERGLVGRAVRTAEVVLVPDTSREAGWLPNPLLPRTRTEIAVPITLGDQVLGVLDVQHDKVNGLGEADADLLQTIASQVAAGLQNAEQYARTQTALAQVRERETQLDLANRRLTQQGWQDFAAEHGEIRVTHGQPAAADGGHALITPILVRGQPIGGLRLSSEHAWTEDESSLVNAVAEELAITLENARLAEQTERALARVSQREAEMRNLVEYAPEAIVIFDADTGRFADPNENAVRLYGLSREALVKVGPADMSPPIQPDGRPSLEVALGYVGQALAGGAPVFEWMNRNAQGQDIPCEVRLVRVPVAGRNLVRASITDITERKAAQAVQAKRAAELATVADLSVAASTLRDTQTMLQTVVDLAQQRFGLYHAHLYLLDENANELVLAAGAGQTGRQMVAEGRVIPLMREQSLVARAARTRQGVIVNDVRAEPGFLPHPLLPETRAELAVPMIVAGQVLGVLDVQSNEINHFTAEDVSIQTTLASQVAAALQNARSFEQTQRALSELNAITRRLSHEGWDQYLAESGGAAHAFVFDHNRVRRLESPAGASAPGGNGGNGADAVTAPLNVQGETIGQLSALVPDEDAAEILNAVADRLSTHLDNLRLLEATERSRRQLDKRASEMETVAKVSAAASSVLEADRLLQNVVDLMKSSFNLYHAHLYLMDEAGEVLYLAFGAGDIGARMALEGRVIPASTERSLVARAARTRQAIIVNDVQAEPGFLPHPLLPETRAEMAVPMIVAERVLGVLDVQANRTDYFTQEDLAIQSTLAAQIAVALQNARLYAEQAATVSRLRELDQLRSSFLANMSHELRTPLNSILGFTDVMLEGLNGPLTDLMENDLKVIQKNGQHLLGLINDVLDMAKIEAGRLNLAVEPFELYELLDEVTMIVGSLARDKALNLEVVRSEPFLEIEADRFRLRQVMINIIGNGIKFTEQGGITLSTTRHGDLVRIAVKDTGLGIPPEKHESVFEAFTQVDTSTTRKVGGTGLGLPISRRLIELHGGRLWVESSGVTGEGSTFFVELPLKAQNPDN